MKKIKHLLLLLFLILMVGVPVYAENPDKVVDNADLLTDKEEEKLQEQFTEIAEKYQCDIAVVTTDTLDGKTAMNYTDDYYYANGYGYGPDIDGIILMVSMEDRDWWIATRGKAIQIFTDYGLGRLKEMFLEDLSDGEYYKAFRTFGTTAEAFMEEAENGQPYDVDHTYSEPFPLWLRLVIAGVAALIVGGVVVTVLYMQLNSVAPEESAEDYIRDGSFKLTGQKDIFLYRTLDKQKIEKDSSSGGGGSTTHTTSDGGTAGGTGGKF